MGERILFPSMGTHSLEQKFWYKDKSLLHEIITGFVWYRIHVAFKWTLKKSWHVEEVRRDGSHPPQDSALSKLWPVLHVSVVPSFSRRTFYVHVRIHFMKQSPWSVPAVKSNKHLYYIRRFPSFRKHIRSIRLLFSPSKPPQRIEYLAYCEGLRSEISWRVASKTRSPLLHSTIPVPYHWILDFRIGISNVLFHSFVTDSK